LSGRFQQWPGNFVRRSNVKSIRTRVAAGATVLALGGLAAVALSADNGGGGGNQAVAERAPVRTEVVRRTVHVTKHAKPKRPAAGSGSGSGGASSAPAPVSVPATTSSAPAPVTSSSGGGAEPAPVTTSTSGSAGAEYGDDGDHEVEYEHEGGDDGGGQDD
jgi:hypothetical protein